MTSLSNNRIDSAAKVFKASSKTILEGIRKEDHDAGLTSTLHNLSIYTEKMNNRP